MKPKTKWVTQNLYGRKRKMEYTQCWHVAERFRLETTVVTQRTAGLDMIIVIHVDDVAKNEKVSKFKNISENTNIFSILFYFWNARDILQFAFAIPNNFLYCWTCFFLPKLRLKAIFNDSIVYTWKEAKRCVSTDVTRWPRSSPHMFGRLSVAPAAWTNTNGPFKQRSPLCRRESIKRGMCV